MRSSGDCPKAQHVMSRKARMRIFPPKSVWASKDKHGHAREIIDSPCNRELRCAFAGQLQFPVMRTTGRHRFHTTVRSGPFWILKYPVKIGSLSVMIAIYWLLHCWHRRVANRSGSSTSSRTGIPSLLDGSSSTNRSDPVVNSFTACPFAVLKFPAR